MYIIDNLSMKRIGAMKVENDASIKAETRGNTAAEPAGESNKFKIERSRSFQRRRRVVRIFFYLSF